MFGQKLVLMGAVLAASAAVASATNYNGNGGTGFGGGVGGAVLTVTDGGANINFSVNSGAASFAGNDLVLYIDSVAGGVNDTSSFTDTADGGRTAISGFSSNGRTLDTFVPAFGADYAISIEPSSFVGLFSLSNPANFGFVNSGNQNTTGNVVTFALAKSDLGLSPAGGTFFFEGSLISTSGYRSNETIGTSVTTPDPSNPPNAGFAFPQTFTSENSFDYSATPEPTTLGLAGIAGLGLLGRRRRA